MEFPLYLTSITTNIEALKKDTKIYFDQTEYKQGSSVIYTIKLTSSTTRSLKVLSWQLKLVRFIFSFICHVMNDDRISSYSINN